MKVIQIKFEILKFTIICGIQGMPRNKGFANNSSNKRV